MAPKRSLSQLMSEQNHTIGSLAEKSGVSPSTVRRAVQGNGTSRLNTGSATGIARGLGTDVDGINWRSDLTNRGKPGGSGKKHTD